MEILLNEVDTRVLGCLIEKALSTPDYYPLTLNSLTAACNQKSNREPVMSLQETEVVRALDRLRAQHLATETHVAGSRVAKYEHKVDAALGLDTPQLAVLCVLLLRGPQTVGQIRARTTKLCSFLDVSGVAKTLEELATREGDSLTVQLPRLPGQKESRFMHLLSGEPDLDQLQANPPLEGATFAVRVENKHLSDLEERVQSLQQQLDELRTSFETFKDQFE